MERPLERIRAKEYFTILAGIVLITNIAILLDIPVFRQVLGFLCFTIIPGLLILHILRLRGIGFVKGFLISVGLSISFLMFVGLLINATLPLFGYSTPLSTTSLVISFSLVLAALCFIAYQRNKHDFHFPGISHLQTGSKNQLISPLLLSLLFPLLSVLGMHLMNTTGNNVILITMLSLIPAYVILLVCLNKRIPQATYPVAILMISMALLLMYGLRSNYIIGTDIYGEFYAFQMVLYNLYWWSPPGVEGGLFACLSVSLLPTVYHSLLGISELYIFKAVFPLIASLIPLASYAFFKRYIAPRNAFLAAMFSMAQIPFMHILTGNARMMMSILFFALAMMVFFDDKLGEPKKRLLFMVFLLSVVVSHYTTAYIFFILLLLYWLITKLPIPQLKTLKGMTWGGVALLFAAIFIWYGQLTQTMFAPGVTFVEGTLRHLFDLFYEELRNPLMWAIFTGAPGIEPSVPERISIIIHNITFILITIGVFSCLISRKARFDSNYRVMMLVSWAILASMVILPFVSVHYSPERTYMQLVVLVAPAFLIGIETICRYIRRQFTVPLITLILVAQFLCASFLIYEPWGIPFSHHLHTTGTRYNVYFVHDSEIAAHRWLDEHNTKNLTIYGDGSLVMSFQLAIHPAGRQFPVSGSLFKEGTPTKDGYIFLRQANIISGLVYNRGIFKDGIVEMREFPHLFEGKNRIYASGSVKIYR